MSRDRMEFLFLNAGHFLDHLFMLIFATVAAVRLADEWGMSYAALIPYATPGFIAFGVGAIAAGWIADMWSREGMMVIFFIAARHDGHLLHRHRGQLGRHGAGVGGYASSWCSRSVAIAGITPGRTVFAFVAGLQAVFFALMYRLTGLAALAVAVACMLVVFGQIPINDVLVGRITRSAWRSRVYSLRYIVTFSVMASTLPVIAGIHAGWGFAALFLVLAVAASGIFAAVLVLPRTAASG